MSRPGGPRVEPIARWKTDTYTEAHHHHQLGQPPGPVNIYDDSELARRLMASFLSQPRSRAVGVHLYKMTTVHLLARLADAEQLDNQTRSASAVAKL